MKRLMSTIKKKGSSPTPNGSSTPPPQTLPQGDAPEAVVVREVTAFCESGAPGSSNAGDEYLHLPAIVDAAESSPLAAREAANTIRRFLSKEYNQRGYAQYNAIMLARILTDNPGRPFTQNFDDKFISTTKSLLREGKDQSVQQILRETLDYFEAQKARENDSLNPLLTMWKKEKSKGARFPQQGPVVSFASDVFVPDSTTTEADNSSTQYPNARYQSYPHQSSRAPKGLPPPDELAARIEEAKTTARLLIQTVQSTPQSELVGNDLVKEFAERSRSAHKSIQQYMNSENPHPDEETMLTLIETNDQLNVAMSKHHRALLQARKATGVATPSPQATGQEANSYMGSGGMPTHTQGQNVYGNLSQSQPQREQQNPYSVSPPRSPPERAPTLPLRDPSRTDNFTAPLGPPPSQHPQQPFQQQYEYEDAYSAPTSPPPGRGPLNDTTNTANSQPFSPVSAVDGRPSQPQHAHTSSKEYGVSDNPFADDYAAEPQQQQQQPPPPQKGYSLFDRARYHVGGGGGGVGQTQNQPGQEERK